MGQKICVISFDHWDYDHHIVSMLKKLGHDSNHIKISDYKHKNIKDKITNTFSKVFKGENLKKIRRQENILSQLKTFGRQDKILVINPEIISLENHLKIKEYCTEYIAYLYDSVNRNPIQHLLNGVFDTIYSFDKNDIIDYNFKPTTNYIYLPLEDRKEPFKFDVVYLGSFDDRVLILLNLIEKLEKASVRFNCIIVGRNKKLNYLKKDYSNKINFNEKQLSQKELIEFYKSGKIIIDLVRKEQTGLSFRFFEALALQRKVITNNANVKNYSFYNSENIFVLDDENDLKKTFFETNYKPLDTSIYNEYTLDTWVRNIFNLK